MTTDWDIHIIDNREEPAEYHILVPVEGYRIITINCGTWEEAERIRLEIISDYP